MATINLKEWVPDAAALGNPGAIVVTNALPGLNSYKPLRSLVLSTDALSARPLGAIEASDANENVFQYAGDASALYALSGMTWGNVSKGGGYSTAAGERWEFARWKERIIATNFTDSPQVITFGGANFADLTTALRFRHVGIVRDFVVAGYTYDGVDGIVRDRVRWSAINDETDWTASAVTLSDFRDLSVGGGIQAIVGGEYGVIVSEKSVFRMTFVGTPTVFQIDETVPGVGALAPGGVISFGDTVYFPSKHGFIAVRNGAQADFIGVGRVDEFFLGDLDSNYLDRVSAVTDPESQLVIWAYPGAGNTAGRPNRLIVFNRALNKWGFFSIETEMIWRSGGTSFTLEDLDDLALGADLVSVGDFASDTVWTKGTGWSIAAGVATHAAGTGSDLSQTLAGLSTGSYYRLVFDVSGRTAGTVTPSIGGTAGTAISADATAITETIIDGGGGSVSFTASSDFDGSIDNVSVKLVTGIDSLTVPFDSGQYKGSAALLAAFDSTYANGNFTGPVYPATFETREVELNEMRKTMLTSFMPVIDGGTVTGRIGYRDRQSDMVEYTSPLVLSASGRFTKRVNARYHRFEMTVSGDWEKAIGAQVDRTVAKAGQRRG